MNSRPSLYEHHNQIEDPPQWWESAGHVGAPPAPPWSTPAPERVPSAVARRTAPISAYPPDPQPIRRQNGVTWWQSVRAGRPAPRFRGGTSPVALSEPGGLFLIGLATIGLGWIFATFWYARRFVRFRRSIGWMRQTVGSLGWSIAFGALSALAALTAVALIAGTGSQ